MTPMLTTWLSSERRLRAVLSLLLLLPAACARNNSAEKQKENASRSVAAEETPAKEAPSPAAAAAPEQRGANPDAPPAWLARSCREICVHTRTLKCEHTAECMPNCIAMGSLQSCTDKLTGFFRCLVAQPAENWECSPDGIALVREGFCAREQGDVASCLETKTN